MLSTDYKQRWLNALPDELDFWREWFETKGGEWPEDYHRRLDAEGELQENLKEFLADHSEASVSILDVGSGPITRLGHRWAGREVKLTAVDALADRYNQLLDELGIAPPLKTRQGSGETLRELFADGTFDLAYCRNALDHAHSPIEAIRQMIAVTKPGGLVVLEHYRNEADQCGYEGLHQWNFDVQNGRFVVWNRQATIDVAHATSDLATCEWELKQIGRWWVYAVLRRHAGSRG